MNTYSYSLATNNENSVIDQEIREFVTAENITDAYSKVITIIADLNSTSSDYKWTLKTLENCYFVGFNDRVHMHNNYCDDSTIQQDKCECCK